MKISQLSNLTQNIFALLILLIIILIGVLINPEGPNGAHGIFLPSQNYIPHFNNPDASTVQVLNLYPQGQALKNIGVIATSIHWDHLSDQATSALYQESLNQAKYLAAQAGATAIYFVHATAGGAPGSPLNSFATQFIVLK